jgi:hypothetical protein
MARKDGFDPVTRSVQTKMGMAGVVDIIGGSIWLVPFFGLLFPGSRDLQDNNVTLTIEKSTTSAASQ